MNKLSSQDRAALIKLASTMPTGSEERKAILAGLSGTGKTAASVMKGSIAADYHKGQGYVELVEFRKAVRKYALVKAREFAHAANAGVEPYSEGAQGTEWLIDDMFIGGSSVHGDYVTFNIQDGQSDLTVTLKLGTYEIQGY